MESLVPTSKPRLAVHQANTILDMMKDMKAEGKDISLILDHRPDGRGDEVQARFYSIYTLTNAGGTTDRVVAHFNREVGIPSILKVDFHGRFAIDTDVALEFFDMRDITLAEAYKKHPMFESHPDLEFEDKAPANKITLAGISGAKPITKGGNSNPSVTIDV